MRIPRIPMSLNFLVLLVFLRVLPLSFSLLLVVLVLPFSLTITMEGVLVVLLSLVHHVACIHSIYVYGGDIVLPYTPFLSRNAL